MFNRIFNESDKIVTDYVYQIAASAVVFSNRDSFEETLGISITELPMDVLKKQSIVLDEWLNTHLPDNSAISHMAYEVADILGLDGFSFSLDKVAESP